MLVGLEVKYLLIQLILYVVEFGENFQYVFPVMFFEYSEHVHLTNPKECQVSLMMKGQVTFQISRAVGKNKTYWADESFS